MEQVIYVKSQKGSYQGYQYHNYLVHIVDKPIKTDDAIGTKSTVLKFKAKDVEKLNPMLWVGKYIEVAYDRYGNPININISDKS